MDSSSNWIFKKSDYIKYTPSRRDEISKDEEDYKRSKGVRFIIDVSQHLQLPQITIATAATFLHRFYMRKSFKEFHHYDIGGTCVFMACKTEEVSRKMKEVAIACAKSARKDKHLKDEKEFDKWHHTITKREPTIAATLCFDLSVEHPYKSLVEFFKGSKGAKGYEGDDLENLFGSAWAFINDSFLTTTSVLYKPNVIASAVIFIASKLWGVQLNVEEKWWKKTKSSIYDIAEAVDDILEIYKLCKPRVVKKKKESGESSEESGNPLDNTEIENLVSASQNSDISNSETQTPKIESPDIKIEESMVEPIDDELEDGQISDDEKTNGIEEIGQEANGHVEMDWDANNDAKS